MYTNASHAACVCVHLGEADGGGEDGVNIGGLFRLFLSYPTVGL